MSDKTFADVKIKGPKSLATPEFNGDQMLDAVIRAVEGLRAEKPEGVTTDDIVGVVAAVADAVEALTDARNALRKAKGLKKLTGEGIHEGIPAGVYLTDQQRVTILLLAMAQAGDDWTNQVSALALLCGWSNERAKAAFEKAEKDGLVKLTPLVKEA